MTFLLLTESVGNANTPEDEVAPGKVTPEVAAARKVDFQELNIDIMCWPCLVKRALQLATQGVRVELSDRLLGSGCSIEVLNQC